MLGNVGIAGGIGMTRSTCVRWTMSKLIMLDKYALEKL